MILGILSDSHGRAERVAHAIRLLKQCGAEAFIHCGDVGNELVFDELAGLRCWFVWGNCDRGDTAQERYAEALGLTPPRSVPLELTLADKSIAVFHGHEPSYLRYRHTLAPDAEVLRKRWGRVYDYVLTGHTHEASDQRFQKTRVINPGALHRVTVYTVATLDLKTDELLFWQVQDDVVGVPKRHAL